MIIKNYIKEKEINSKEIKLKIPIIYEIMKKYINEEISKEELDLLYKRSENDPDYMKSEDVRATICSRLQRLHLQNKIDHALKRVNPVQRYKSKMIVQRSFIDGKVLVGGYMLNENLYKILPYKLSLYIAKKLSQRENQKNHEYDVLLDEEIAELTEDISGHSTEQIKNAEESMSSETPKSIDDIIQGEDASFGK